jgi:hypothetical protein
MTATLLVYWDYDTQWGADRSRRNGGKQTWGALEFENTELLLDVHAEFNIAACFAVVGAAALPGSRPYHDPEQIRKIHAAGHEVGSHSFHHDWLPGLSQGQLRETLKKSKDALEQCISAPVTAFVPPWNQPFDYPAKGSFSIAERREAGRSHVHLGHLCDALDEVGYRTCRVAYRPLHLKIVEKILGRRRPLIGKMERIGNIACFRLNASCGFDQPAIDALQQNVRGNGVVVVYGHPHSASMAGAQSLENLRKFFQVAADLRTQGRLRVALPRELVNAAGF